MSLTFDATMKDLGADYPRDILTTFDGPTSRPIKPINIDLSTVTTSADFVVGLGDPVEEVVHIDFQASASATKDKDVFVYNALLHRQYLVPVHSIIVLLWPSAMHSNLTGKITYAPRPPHGTMTFGYEVEKLWERPAAELLQGPLGTTPLAMLGKLPQGVKLEDGLTAVARQLVQRLEANASFAQAKKLLTSAFLLTGLLVRRPIAKQVFSGVLDVFDARESDTYQTIIENREDGAKDILFPVGEQRFGPIDEANRLRLEAIVDHHRLKRMGLRLLTATSWDDLLNTP